jgi:anti-sigma-K factor RskA
MITERQEEQAALHALGLLEGAEKTAFEAELARNAELQALVASFVQSSAQLALAVPQIDPPVALRARVLAATEPPVAGGKAVAFPVTRWLPLAAAAGLALAVLWLGWKNFGLRQENIALKSERELAEIAYKSARTELQQRSLVAENMINELGRQLRQEQDMTRLKVTALASLAGNTKEAQAIAIWDPAKQSGLLTVEKLPAIADDQDYQIWVVDPAHKEPISGGVFHVEADGRVAFGFKPDQPVTQAAAFAVSVEKKGGAAKNEGPIVLLGKR